MTYSPDSTNPVAVALQENETQTTATLAAIIVKTKAGQHVVRPVHPGCKVIPKGRELD